MIHTLRPSPERLARASRTAAAALSLASLIACAGLPAKGGPGPGEVLQSNLQIAAAALAAGQPDVARRLYLSLAERFREAPEPALGLGYITFQDGDFAAAERHFLQAAERAADAPARRAEALLGAGRSALARGAARDARRHLQDARRIGEGTPAAPWIANGLAVAAALEADYETAEAQYTEALRLSSGHPRIAANFVRMLISAGRFDDAARMHAQYDPSYWAGDDDRTLLRLLHESRRGLGSPSGEDATPHLPQGPLE